MREEKIRKIAAEILKAGKNRVWIDSEQRESVKEAITREDVRGLIAEGIIKKIIVNVQSKGRTRKLKAKKAKGQRKGPGSRKGTKKSRTEKKKRWASKVRAQRKRLKELKKEEKKSVEEIGYHRLYKMVKGNYFKGKRYLERYVKEKVVK